jgi:hypothetical protein
MLAAAGAAAACEGLEAAMPAVAATVAVATDGAACETAVGRADGALVTAAPADGDVGRIIAVTDAECRLDMAEAGVTAARA